MTYKPEAFSLIGLVVWTPVGTDRAERVTVLSGSDMPDWYRVRDEQGHVHLTHKSHLYLTRPAAEVKA